MSEPFLTGGGPASTQPRPIEDYELSLGETFGVAARNAFDNSLISDLVRGARAGLDTLGRARDYTRGARTTYDAETARKKAKEAGVEIDVPDEGMGFAEFDTLVELRKRQKRDAVELGMRPKTAAGWAAETAGSFAGFSVDPINVAAAFIPFVGEARYASALARAGSSGFARAGVRLGYGAVEGAAGVALLEPLNLALNARYEPEYGLTDSFLNIVFGGVLGGGLHVMGGLGRDAFVSRARRIAGEAPELVSRQALHESVTALEAGRRVDVAPVFRDPRLDPMNDTAFLAGNTGRSVDLADADIERALQDVRLAGSGDTGPRDLVRDIINNGGIKIVDAKGELTPEGQNIRDLYGGRYPPGLVNNKTGQPLDYVRERLEQEGWFPGREGDTLPDDVTQLLSQHQGGKKPVRADEINFEDGRPLKAELKEAGVKASDPEDVKAFKLAQHRALKALRANDDDLAELAVEPDTYDPSTGFEPREMADLRTQADEALALRDDGTDLDGEIEALGEYLNMARKREVLSAADENVLALADEFDAKAKRSGDAYRAAAACLSGLA